MSLSSEVLVHIHRAALCVEERLRGPLSVHDMADAAGLSLFHFSRVFNTAVCHSPYDYLVRRRLSVAAREVLYASRSITDIALDYGFHTPEGFARAFRRMFNALPSTVRKTKSIDERRFVDPVTLGDLGTLARTEHFKPSLAALPDREVHGYADRCSNAGFTDNPVFGTDIIVVDYPPDWREKGPQILYGISEGASDLTCSLRTTLAAGNYARFCSISAGEVLECFLRYLFSTFWPRVGSPNLPDRLHFRREDRHTWHAYVPVP
jgi:AraC-like DNA-binding protein